MPDGCTQDRLPRVCCGKRQHEVIGDPVEGPLDQDSFFPQMHAEPGRFIAIQPRPDVRYRAPTAELHDPMTYNERDNIS